MGRWKGPVLGGVASLAAFACVAAALDGGLLPRAYPAPVSRSDEAAILGAVHDYQRAYQDFYATGGNPALLDAVPASKPAKHQIFRDIGFLRDSRLLLIQDLASVTLLETRMVARDAAEVLVFEEWNWALQRAADRSMVSEVSGLGQGFRYRVGREGGRWVVASWDVEDVTPAPAAVRNW